MLISFRNPRLLAEFANWPSVGKQVSCVFRVHRCKRGWRVSRVTTGKPKFTTYSGQCCIVTGSNDRTYILQACPEYGFIDIKAGDFYCANGKEIGRERSAVFLKEEPDLYNDLAKLIVESKAMLMEIST